MAHVVKCDLCGYVEDGTLRVFHVMPRVVSSTERRVTGCLPGVDVCQTCLPLEVWKAIMDRSREIEGRLKETLPGGTTECGGSVV